MSWETEESNIKFLNWDKKKADLDEDQVFVVEKGDEIQAVITNIKEDYTEEGDLKDVRYNLQVKGEDKEVLAWCNASMLRQHKSLDIKEGDEIKLRYVGEYDTGHANKGKQIKVAVKR